MDDDLMADLEEWMNAFRASKKTDFQLVADVANLGGYAAPGQARVTIEAERARCCTHLKNSIPPTRSLTR